MPALTLALPTALQQAQARYAIPFGALDRMALKARLDELAQPLAAGARA